MNGAGRGGLEDAVRKALRGGPDLRRLLPWRDRARLAVTRVRDRAGIRLAEGGHVKAAARLWRIRAAGL